MARSAVPGRWSREELWRTSSLPTCLSPETEADRYRWGMNDCSRQFGTEGADRRTEHESRAGYGLRAATDS